jgi:hypothetical protein
MGVSFCGMVAHISIGKRGGLVKLPPRSRIAFDYPLSLSW